MKIRFDYTIPDGDADVECEVCASFSAGSPDTYSPMNGAEGGDPDEIEIDSITGPDGKVYDFDSLPDATRDGIGPR